MALLALATGSGLAACGDDAARPADDDDGAGAGVNVGGQGGGDGGGATCDLDADGHDGLDCGGDDCNDHDPSVFFGAADGAIKEVIGPHASVGDRLGFTLDAAGTMHLVEPGHLTYWTNDGGGWVSEVIGDDSAHPSLALDASGAVHLAYGKFDPGDGKGLAYATNLGGSFQTEWIDLSPLEYTRDASLGVGPDGTVHVVYVVENDWGIVRYAEKAPNGSWQLSVLTETSSASGVSLAVASDGAVHVVYDDFGLQHATKNGGAWTIEPIPGASYQPALVLDAQDKAHVAFLGRGSTTEEYEGLFYASNVSGGWQKEDVDDTADGSSPHWHYRPALAIDDGMVQIAYGSGYPRELRVAAKHEGVWHTAVADDRSNPGYAPALAIDEGGLGHAVYLDFCANELRHAAFTPPDGIDQGCDGAIDAVAIPEAPSCSAGDPPQAIAFEHTCVSGQGAFTSYVADDRTAPELHLVGVYEAAAGVIDVHLDRSTPAVLVLSSYEKVRWRVTTADDACLQKIIVNSDAIGCVVAPEGVEIEAHYATDWLGECAFGWPSTTGGCDTPALVAAAEQASGLTLASFSGCYQGNSFTIGH